MAETVGSCAANTTNAAHTASTLSTVPAGILRRSMPAHSCSE